jgi:hypothetical protein
MASFAHNLIPPNLFERIFRLECPADRVSFFRNYESWRDIYRVDLTRMFNNQKLKLECPKMAIIPGRNSFNTASCTYSNDVWDNWVDESTSSTTTRYLYNSPTSQTVATSTVTWTTWVRDRYVYYHDIETYRGEERRLEAVWSVWTDESTRVIYEGVADEVTEGLREATERMGRAFEQVALSSEEAGNAMRRLGNVGQRMQEESEEIKKIREQKEAAEAKAKELLLDIIGKDELAVYEETGRVFVRGRKHDYIVQRTGFVQQIQQGKIQDLCAHINKTKYPLTDNVVAMKMLIESDEEQFLKIANKHSSRSYDELPKAACM